MIRLGSRLLHAGKDKKLSQETTAKQLGASRQTILKWKTAETLPDIQQSKRRRLCMADLEMSGSSLILMERKCRKSLKNK